MTFLKAFADYDRQIEAYINPEEISSLEWIENGTTDVYLKNGKHYYVLQDVDELVNLLNWD